MIPESTPDILLREIHHRVKNNLQIISSILDLSARSTEYTNPVREVFVQCQNRIQSIALIHEHLYSENSGFSHINFHSYLRSLCGYLESLSRKDLNSPPRLQIRGAMALVPIDVASPCGLIASELITNSLKYSDGMIEINLSEEADSFCFEVIDHGPGWPTNKENTEQKPQTSGTGLKLVRILCRQVGASFNVKTRPEFPGTCVQVRVPIVNG